MKLRIVSLICLFFLSFLFRGQAIARVENTLELYERVHILSDKAYRHGDRDQFEAVGNVVASYQDKSLYGEKLTVDSSTGEIRVYGNIRYVAAGVTLYGSEMYFNSRTGEYTVKNARVHASNFVILGKTLSRLPDETLFGEDAEYTTCLDCPESWVIQGKEVRITMGEYISIKHALMKVKGVAIMYIPYIVFPIKKKRESGFLFPQFSLDLEKGITYQQPFFWAIGDYNDLTVTPSVWGSRGLGNEFQYRQNFGERRWFELNHLGVFDQLYQLNSADEKKTGNSYFRHLSEYEHHYNFGRNLSHHFRFDLAKDLDIIRDYDDFSSSRMLGSEIGASGFIDYRGSLFDLSLEGSQMRNLLVDDASAFDRSYVQILPEVKFSLMPISLLHSSTPLLADLAVGLDADATRFRQSDVDEGNFIRNADRYHFSPFVDWNLGNFGPVSLKTSGQMDYYRYYFPYEDDKSFHKTNSRIVSEMNFGVEKIFGIAHKRKIGARDVSLEKEKKDFGLAGEIPAYSVSNMNRQEEELFYSYRHGQEFKLKHYYTFNERVRGNDVFENQIGEDAGLFDYNDALKRNEHNLSGSTFKQELPVANTLELQWNNSLIRKSPRNFSVFEDGRLLRDNFSYARIAYFNISQGYDLSAGDSTINRLTRLYVDTGFTVNKTNFRGSEFFFYNQKKHIFSVGASQTFSRLVASADYRYNNASSPIESTIVLGLQFTPLDMLSGNFSYSYDLAADALTERNLGIVYRPSNNCWSLTVGQKKNEIDTRYSFHFEINFNDNSFNSLDLL